MGRRTTRRPKRRSEVNRPSMFFIIALSVGLILFFILVVMIARHPPKQQQGALRGGAPSATLQG